MPEISLVQAMQIGIEHHRMGRLGEAETIYRQILSSRPGDPAALYRLGILALEVGKFQVALALLKRSATGLPDAEEVQIALGNAYRAGGNVKEALGAYEAAIRLQRDSAEAHHNRGTLLQEAGDLDAATSAYREVLRIVPRSFAANYNLGIVLESKCQFAEAAQAYEQAIQIDPGTADSHHNLGNCLKAMGRLDEAVIAYQETLRLRPTHGPAHYNLGNALQSQGQFESAICAYRKALQIIPHYAFVWNNLGNSLLALGRPVEAISAYREALRIEPLYAEGYNNLGAALKAIGQLDEAIEAHQRAAHLQPDSARIQDTLGFALLAAGRLGESTAAHAQAMKLDPANPSSHSHRLVNLHHDPAYDSMALLREHQEWNRRHATPYAARIRPHLNKRTECRRLRIGYVSPHFGEHVLGYTFLPILRGHDHEQMEIFCYSNVQRTDSMTDLCRSSAQGWRDIRGLSDDQAAELIRSDEIDILVDLALHSSDNRLPVFARKPAPVQVTYLGYCSTTGLEAMDYRLSDWHIDPHGSDLGCYSEETIRLANGYWCYEPNSPAPEVTSCPWQTSNYTTFGCLNNFTKISDAALHLWGKILEAVPESRLVLHAPAGSWRDRAGRLLSIYGVDDGRIEFVPRMPREEYLQMWQSIDIALDPFPWTGGISTCDALWMGVPTISLSGKTAVGRGGKSILSTLGLQELVASDEHEYLQITLGIVNNKERLLDLRKTLRDCMRQSPLLDTGRFVRDLETVYRDLWKRWCTRNTP